MPDTYRFAPIEECDLANGMHLMLLSDAQQPALTVALQFPLGHYADERGREGSSELSLGMLQNGTRELSHAAFAERIERSGSALFGDTGEEHVLLGCRMLAAKTAEVVPLFRDMICAPRLEEGELRRLKREMRAALDAQRSDTMALARRQFCARLFHGHAAGRMPDAASVGRVDMAAITRCLSRWRRPRGALLLVAGDLSGAAGMRWWQELFSNWSVDGDPVLAPPPPQALPPDPDIYFVDRDDSTQVSLCIGHRMPGEDCPHRHHVALANHVLGGGGFSSRLTTAIRVKLGATYGADSRVWRSRYFGALSMSAATLNERAAEMLAAMRAVYAEFAAQGITREELADAAAYAKGSLAFQLEGAPQVAGKLLWLWRTGRDRGSVERFGEELDTITLESVNAAIRQYFTPERLLVCAAGRRRTAETLLKQHGPVRVRHYRQTIH